MQNLFETHEKEQIGRMLIDRFKASGFASQAKFAKSIGFNPADLTNLKGQKWKESPQLIGQDKWIRLARYVGYTRDEAQRWLSADTYVKQFITQQLTTYQTFQFSGIFCDDAGIGKTHACKEYVKKHPNAFYIDCSKSRTRNKMIKALAIAVGLETDGRYDDILENAIYALELMSNPIVVWDEAGDLDDRAFLELKRIYNDLEGKCAFFLIAADGMKSKIKRGIACKKVGFTEVFSRFGKKFSSVVPEVKEEKAEFLREMAVTILRTNGVTDQPTIRKILTSLTDEGGLKDMRTVYREVIKLRAKKMAA